LVSRSIRPSPEHVLTQRIETIAPQVHGTTHAIWTR
jgi:hypothetical protein